MSTVGHPLSDVCNFMTPFYMAKMEGASPYDTSAFLPGRTPGLPDPAQIMKWYTEVSGYDPRAELNWGIAFNIFKLAGVYQGIAARYASRQASSEQAKQNGLFRGPMADFAWALAQDVRKGESPRL